MRSLRLVAFLVGALVLSGGLVGQDRKGDGKDPKKDDQPTKAKGQLPTYWGQLGLSEEQKQKVYKVQNKYGEEIEKLEAKIKELKDKRDKDRFDILSNDQKKRLEEIIKSKAGGGGKGDK
jgi:hypothetical protein